DGKLLSQVTKGEWEVREVIRVDAEEKTVYFSAAMICQTGTDFCGTELGGGAGLLSDKGKTHRVSLAPTGGLYIDRYSDPMTPTRASVNEAGKGSVRTLDTNPVYERDKYKFGKFERVKIPMKDGFVLEGSVTLP